LELAHGTQERLRFKAQAAETVHEEISKKSEPINKVKELELCVSLENLRLEQNALKQDPPNYIGENTSKVIDENRTYLPEV
jgi:hypothetical protein